MALNVVGSGMTVILFLARNSGEDKIVCAGSWSWWRNQYPNTLSRLLLLHIFKQILYRVSSSMSLWKTVIMFKSMVVGKALHIWANLSCLVSCMERMDFVTLFWHCTYKSKSHYLWLTLKGILGLSEASLYILAHSNTILLPVLAQQAGHTFGGNMMQVQTILWIALHWPKQSFQNADNFTHDDSSISEDKFLHSIEIFIFLHSSMDIFSTGHLQER